MKGNKVYNFMNTFIYNTRTGITQKLITFTKYFVKKVYLLLHLNQNTTLFSHGIWIQIQQQMTYFSKKNMNTIPFSVLPTDTTH